MVVQMFFVVVQTVAPGALLCLKPGGRTHKYGPASRRKGHLSEGFFGSVFSFMSRAGFSCLLCVCVLVWQHLALRCGFAFSHFQTKKNVRSASS
jgi:hypothetical protein